MKNKVTTKVVLTQWLLILLLFLCSTHGMQTKPSKEFVESFSKLILSKLGLSRPPPAKKHPGGIGQMVKEHSVRAWKRHSDFEDQHVEVAVSTIPARVTQSASHLIFAFNSNVMFQQNYTIKSAKLNFIPKTELVASKSSISIYRKKVMRYAISLDFMSHRPLKKNKTLQINIFDDITAWQATHGSRAEYRLKLKCNRKPCIETSCTPFIDLEYEKKHVRRDVQSKDLCGDNECCRKTVRVSVEDLGWKDWFFMPSSFDYHYCTGKCSRGKMYDHLLSSLLNTTTCCAPTGLTGFRILYTMNGFIYEKKLYDVMASGCACGGIAGV